MTDTTIHHVTLTTGHVRQVEAGEIGDDAIRMLRPVMEQALTGTPAQVPGIEGYTLTGGSDVSACIAVTVHGPPPDRVPIVTTGVALDSTCGQDLWPKLHGLEGTLGVVTDPANPPAVPWVADVLMAGAYYHEGALEWTGDLARCMAWTWWYREGSDE